MCYWMLVPTLMRSITSDFHRSLNVSSKNFQEALTFFVSICVAALTSLS